MLIRQRQIFATLHSHQCPLSLTQSPIVIDRDEIGSNLADKAFRISAIEHTQRIIVKAN